jgi:hypothetical protein
MADDTRQKLCLHALQHAAGRLRAIVAEQVSMRQVPWLTFHLDQSVRRGAEMVEQLDRLMRESGQTPSFSPDAPAAEEPRPFAATEEPTDSDSHPLVENPSKQEA